MFLLLLLGFTSAHAAGFTNFSGNWEGTCHEGTRRYSAKMFIEMKDDTSMLMSVTTFKLPDIAVEYKDDYEMTRHAYEWNENKTEITLYREWGRPTAKNSDFIPRGYDRTKLRMVGTSLEITDQSKGGWSGGYTLVCTYPIRR